MRYLAILALLVSSLALKSTEAFGDEVTTEDGYLAVEETSSGVEEVNETKAAPEVAKVQNLATNEYGSTAADAAEVLGSKSRHSYKTQESKYSLTPMVGGALYTGRWSHHIGNAYTAGLILERRFSKNFSIEAEGSYGSYSITYSNLMHDFNKFAAGLNGKLYVLDGNLRPYVGAGLLAVYYTNMFSGSNRYNKLVGAPQFIVGTDYALSSGIEVGVRGAYVLPSIGTPESLGNGAGSLPGFEEASAIQQSFIRIMGTVKVNL